RHPAYSNYPLLCVSYGQAENFCAWLTKAYSAMPDAKYKNVNFDLPTKDQWMSAARGGQTYPVFPWGGYTMMDKAGKWRANFVPMDDGSAHREYFPRITPRGDTIIDRYYVCDPGDITGSLNDDADFTAPANAFAPNDYGLYNMAGNAEEMVKEKGISKGGSWRDPGYYLRIKTEENYPDSIPASTERGFRIRMTAN
ncbi:MAG TPA: SUMF1/EgtB/PvdO family nonheme iron enzyme, partial [Bacteroidia bacterium]|nr:SUMF1/EgtB/PvdO family nonheme iron enzyme [Bacteroidia bacterium]